jgi:hypothetical protein
MMTRTARSGSSGKTSARSGGTNASSAVSFGGTTAGSDTRTGSSCTLSTGPVAGSGLVIFLVLFGTVAGGGAAGVDA